MFSVARFSRQAGSRSNLSWNPIRFFANPYGECAGGLAPGAVSPAPTGDRCGCLAAEGRWGWLKLPDGNFSAKMRHAGAAEASFRFMNFPTGDSHEIDKA
jgi:hypothetical protein